VRCSKLDSGYPDCAVHWSDFLPRINFRDWKLISGYSLTYRRVFRVGDRVKIGDYIGYVQESKLMVTYLHTVKNEVVAVPNSQIIIRR
jgi:hypothetical protein